MVPMKMAMLQTAPSADEPDDNDSDVSIVHIDIETKKNTIKNKKTNNRYD